MCELRRADRREPALRALPHATLLFASVPYRAMTSGGHKHPALRSRGRAPTQTSRYSRARSAVPRTPAGVRRTTRTAWSASTGATPQTRSCGDARTGAHPGGRTWGAWPRRRRPRARDAAGAADLRCLGLLLDVQTALYGPDPAAVAIALWTKHAREVETDDRRLMAACMYAQALGAAGEHTETARLRRGILDVMARLLGLEYLEALNSAPNLALSLLHLGECAEVAVLLQTTLAAQIRTLRAGDEGTLSTECHLVSALRRLQEFAAAEALGRETLEKQRRVLGRGHFGTLVTSGNLAASLPGQGKHAEAVEVEREVPVQKTRPLGAEHAYTLIAVTNLADSLSLCGQKTEAGQLLRDTLALFLRTPDLNHEVTQHVFGDLRALGLTADR